MNRSQRKVYTFSHSYNRHLLNAQYVPDTALCARHVISLWSSWVWQARPLYLRIQPDLFPTAVGRLFTCRWFIQLQTSYTRLLNLGRHYLTGLRKSRRILSVYVCMVWGVKYIKEIKWELSVLWRNKKQLFIYQQLNQQGYYGFLFNSGMRGP